MSRHETAVTTLRLSYASEPGDRLSPLGGGKVLIRHPDKADRVLDRKTGIITERPYSEYTNIFRDAAVVIGLFIAVSVAIAFFWFF